jgi:hypothetical protein
MIKLKEKLMQDKRKTGLDEKMKLKLKNKNGND